MAQGYTVLARRYRSQNFDELIGQEPVAQTLKNAVSGNRLAHAFLFTGTRGVGKTSAARILAKAINCPNVKDGQPCGVCETCKAIARGEEMDVIEIDGASNNNVDQVRDLRQSAGVRPSHSPYKVYIIDEVHMLTGAAFNALLKTLEEPPDHVKFIFATTDVHKVPATILSRCQRYDFKNIPTARIAAHLADVCRQEKIDADEAALFRVARLGNGSMRDALSLLDRVLSLGETHITEKLLDDLVGKPPIAAVLELVQALADSKAGEALTLTENLLAKGQGPEQLISELVDALRNVMVANLCGADSALLDVPAEMKALFGKLAPRFDAPTLVHHIALCEQTMRNVRVSTMGRVLLDALIVRLALAEQFSTIREQMQGATSGDAGAKSAGSARDAAGVQKKNESLSENAVGEVLQSFRQGPATTANGTGGHAAALVRDNGNANGTPHHRPTDMHDPESAPVSGRPHLRDINGPAHSGSTGGHLAAHDDADRGHGTAQNSNSGDDLLDALESQKRGQGQKQAQEQVAGAPAAVDVDAIWTSVLDYLENNQAASIVTMFNGQSRLISYDPAEGCGVVQIPLHLRSWAGPRIIERLQEGFKQATGRGVRLTTTFPAAAPGGGGAPPAGNHGGAERTPHRPGGAGSGSGPARPTDNHAAPQRTAAPATMAPRVPPELINQVRNHPTIVRLMDKLNATVTSVDFAPDVQPAGEANAEAPA